MHVNSIRFYRLVPRGQAGLACDAEGVALGALDLVRARTDAKGVRRCEARSPDQVGKALRAAYGPQPDEVVLRIHRSLRQAATWIEEEDLCLASVQAVLLGLPDLTPGAMAKLADIADLEKGGTAWQTEPRIPAGQTGGGQWTTGASAPAVNFKPARHSSAESARGEQRPLPIDDGVYRPDFDKPFLIHTGGAEEEEEPNRGSNGPPPDFTTLLDVFPGLRAAPGLAIPIAPVDGYVGVSALAEFEDVENTKDLYNKLVAEIKAVDPNLVRDTLMPKGGIDAMSWQQRGILIDTLRMQRAVALYNIRGDAGPLQVETLRFLQKAVDIAYADAVKDYEAGSLKAYLSREVAIGKFVDRAVRDNLLDFFDRFGVPYGQGRSITINNRDYDTSGPKRAYTVPDARVEDVSFDWTLTFKTISTEQIRGFFGADSQICCTVIVRPSALGQNATYAILRPAVLRPRR
jgi:hypothetical protein